MKDLYGYSQKLINTRAASSNSSDVNKHACSIFSNSTVLSVGYNHVKPNNVSVHAERHACDKLPRRRRPITVDALVTRSGGKLSKPCKHCVQVFCKILTKGYNIKYVYYTTPDGIGKEKLSDLILDENPHISIGNKLKNMNADADAEEDGKN